MASLETPLQVARRDGRATTTDRYVPATAYRPAPLPLRALHCYNPALRTPKELLRAHCLPASPTPSPPDSCASDVAVFVPAHQNKPLSTSTLINTPPVQLFSALRPTPQRHWSRTSTCPFDVAGVIFPRRFSHPTRHFTIAVASHKACLCIITKPVYTPRPST
ncbi:hypothetical protein PMIN06_000292 [Paraphaeosphaeria minitans]